MAIYDVLREINAHYKLSENEFLAKVKTFEKIHEKCLIINIQVKKMIVRNTLNFFIKN